MRFSLPRGTIMEISNLVPSSSASVEGVFVGNISPIVQQFTNATLAIRLQNLNGLSIVFYRSQSAHATLATYTKLEWLVHHILLITVRTCDARNVYIDYCPVWDSLRLTPINLLTEYAFPKNFQSGSFSRSQV